MVGRAIKAMKEMASFSEMLRILGATSVIVSMSLFLLQDWDTGDDTIRYFKLLTQTGLLCLCGFLLANILKENKGARLFFGLGICSIPANFAILSALLLSAFSPTDQLQTIPEYLSWAKPEGSGLIFMFSIALITLVPLTLLAVRIMTRQDVLSISSVFLGLNALILIPMRDSVSSGILILISIGIALLFTKHKQLFSKENSSAGKHFLGLLLFIPGSLIAARSTLLYNADNLLLLILLVTGYTLFRQFSILRTTPGFIRLTTEFLTLPITLFAVIILNEIISDIMGKDIARIISAMTLIAYIIDINRFSYSALLKHGVTVFTSITLCASLVELSIWNTTFSETCIIILGGIGVILLGYKLRNRTTMFTGILTMIIGFALGIDDLIEVLFTGNWLILGSLGITTIILASVVERYGASTKLWLNKHLTKTT